MKSPTRSGRSKGKIAFLANTDWYLFGFKFDLAKKLAAEEFKVSLISPPGKYSQNLKKPGINWIEVQMSRRGVNPIRELVTFFQLASIYKKQKFALVQHFTIKCVIFGTLAAKITGTQNVVNSITGLGHIFVRRSFGADLIRALVIQLYRLVLSETTVIFQNEQDRKLFIQKKIVKLKQTKLVRGSGVDLTKFYFKSEPKNKVPIIVLPGRLLWEKGVGEFVEASKIVNRQKRVARFLLVGEPDPGNPAAISEKQLLKWKLQGLVELKGWQTTMEKIYHQSNVVCLPSYREGLSKTLVEAAACGRSIVTTNIPGCRDVVEDGKTGLLVPARDSKALAKAIITLLNNSALRKQMGKRGRRKAERNFSIEIINEEYLSLYRSLLKLPLQPFA